jgi:hypothetical protein
VDSEALDFFPEEELRILTGVGGTSLVNERGIPDSGVASDHLPLFFRWSV